MKKKISVTLSRDVLARVDQQAGSELSRSSFIEWVLLMHLRKCSDKDRSQMRDLERINRTAQRLNLEAADVLEYQNRR